MPWLRCIKNLSIATEAAMKYFVLGSFASGLLLYGISILYGVTSSIQIDAVAIALQTQQSNVAVAALVFVLAGLIFKFGAVPFHMWVPDVYQGAATTTTLFIASAPKIAAFVITLRILVAAMPSMQVEWIQLLMVVSILSMFLGNVLAIAQTSFKRCLPILLLRILVIPCWVLLRVRIRAMVIQPPCFILPPMS